MIFRGPDPETPLSVSKAMGLAQKYMFLLET